MKSRRLSLVRVTPKWLVLNHAEFFNEAVEAAVEAFPDDIAGRFLRFAALIEQHGLRELRPPHVKHLSGPLWELRMKGKSGIARAVYLTMTGQRLVVVHAFIKKTQKTPRHELELALKRAKEIT